MDSENERKKINEHGTAASFRNSSASGKQKRACTSNLPSLSPHHQRPPLRPCAVTLPATTPCHFRRRREGGIQAKSEATRTCFPPGRDGSRCRRPGIRKSTDLARSSDNGLKRNSSGPWRLGMQKTEANRNGSTSTSTSASSQRRGEKKKGGKRGGAPAPIGRAVCRPCLDGAARPRRCEKRQHEGCALRAVPLCLARKERRKPAAVPRRGRNRIGR